jgi:hypothetical protein
LVPDGINGRYGIAKRARSACSKDRNLHDQSFKNLILIIRGKHWRFLPGRKPVTIRSMRVSPPEGENDKRDIGAGLDIIRPNV